MFKRLLKTQEGNTHTHKKTNHISEILKASLHFLFSSFIHSLSLARSFKCRVQLYTHKHTTYAANIIWYVLWACRCFKCANSGVLAFRYAAAAFAQYWYKFIYTGNDIHDIWNKLSECLHLYFCEDERERDRECEKSHQHTVQYTVGMHCMHPFICETYTFCLVDNSDKSPCE